MYKVFLFLAFVIIMSCKSGSTDDTLQGRKDHRAEIIRTALTQSYPVIKLIQNDGSDRYKAQEIFINHKKVQQVYTENVNKEKILNEIFSVSSVRPSDIPKLKSQCKDGECYRVEMYNFALNLTVLAVANVKTNQLFGLNFYPGIQPDIPPHLVALATQIAREDEKVKAAYGDDMSSSEVLMPATKTALNKSKCERSNHLCVAPTFVKGNKALWAIVDLTDLKVVGVKWTNVGNKMMAVSEKRYQNDNIMTSFCDTETGVNKNNWSFNYSLTRSDGLRISQVKFKDKPLFNDVKLVDWHVSYSKTEGFGYSDAVGCPEYSQAAVLAVEPPFMAPIIENEDTVGFALTQKYFSEGWPKPCNYNYQQNYEFYNDGRFRPLAASLGRGCGMDGIYRPVTRVSIAGNENTASEWKDNKFAPWTNEGWTLQNEKSSFTKENYWFKVANKENNGLYIEANIGQYNPRDKGDNAYAYFTKRHKEQTEGDGDLPTIGPCCNTDYKQGPEKFIGSNPEGILNSELVFWYVPQIENDGRKGQEYCWAESLIENGVYVAREYPCYTGPMFVPILN